MKLGTIIKNLLIFMCIVCMIIIAYLVFTPSFPFHLRVQTGVQPTYVMIGNAPVSYIPFQEIKNIGFWLNIIMTVPLGAFVALVINSKVSFKRVSLYGMFIGLFIEITQFILDNLMKNFYRFVDINDVISNMLGFILGFYLFTLMIKILKNKI